VEDRALVSIADESLKPVPPGHIRKTAPTAITSWCLSWNERYSGVLWARNQ
jgi:hypothetical protein